MGSVAWDVRTGEIVYCIPKMGHGEVYEKRHWDIVFENNPDYPEFIRTSGDGPELTTHKAQELFRVINDQIVAKPKPILAVGEPIEGVPCEITLDFEYLLPEDDLGAVQARFEGKGLVPVDITLQMGVNIFIFDVLGDLTLRVTDKRVQETVLELEVLPGEGY